MTARPPLSNDDMAVTVSHLALLLKRDDLGYQSFTIKQAIDQICQLLQERAELQEQVERLQESCESAVVEIDRLRRERDEWHGRAAESVRLRRERDDHAAEIDRLRRQLEVHQSANPALLGALEMAGDDPVGFFGER